MKIISHRGYWLNPNEKNSRQAFVRSFELGFGTETDVRDCQGKLVISHDPPKGNELTLEEVLQLAAPSHPLLAINVKSDGLAFAINALMKQYDYKNWFVFDMSIPDTRSQLLAGNPAFVRMSEVESNPAYLHQAAGIWFDAFDSDDWRIDSLKKLIAAGITTCIVSPELHQRNQLPFWDSLKKHGFSEHSGLILCTDFPELASSYFSNYD